MNAARLLQHFERISEAPDAASTNFSLITGGKYYRLLRDEADDKPVLSAESADGVRLGVEAMSDGTADQLYLALQPAAHDP